jgi:hypothetical protein
MKNGLLTSMRQRGAALLEYVIIAVGIAIFCTFGILMFGKAAQSQMDSATQVLSGNTTADDATQHDQAKATADQSETDDSGRTAEDMARN